MCYQSVICLETVLKIGQWNYYSHIEVSPEGTLSLPSVRVSVCLVVRPSPKSGSCNNLKTVWSLLMKLGKWIDEKVEIMHVLLFYSSTINFGCYVNLKWIDGKVEIMHVLSFC